MGDALPGRAATWMMLMTGVDIGVAGVMMMTGGDHARRTLPGPMVTKMTTSGDADAMGAPDCLSETPVMHTIHDPRNAHEST
jgi:hypothetical protein